MFIRLLKFSISCLYYLLFQLYVFIYYLVKNVYPKKLIILTYHSVKDEEAHIFEKHMIEILNRGEPVSLDNLEKIGHRRNYIAITFDDGYQSTIKNAIPIMKSKNIPATIFITTGFLGERPGWILDTNNENRSELLLTESQIEDQSLSSTQLGSHTVSHPHLNKLGKEELFHEVYESKKRLERITQKTIDKISLPFGSCNDDVIRIISEAGYKKIFLNVPAKKKTTDNAVIYGRTNVSTDDWELEFRLKISGAYEWLPVGIYLKKVILQDYLK